jgi:hypothetical protein
MYPNLHGDWIAHQGGLIMSDGPGHVIGIISLAEVRTETR